MDSVFYGGVRLPVYADVELNRLDGASLREHALTLYRVLGQERVGLPPPVRYDDLIAYVRRIQQDYLWALRGVPVDDGLALWDRGSYWGRTQKFVLGEDHSRHAIELSRSNPGLASAILKEVNDGIQRFHDGIYGGDLYLSQKKLAEDIYKELTRDKPDSFWYFKDMFLNFSVTVGQSGFAGNIPCFRYKIAYPEAFRAVMDTAYVTVFFTLKETEMRRLFGDVTYWDAALVGPLSYSSLSPRYGSYRSLSPRYASWARDIRDPVLPYGNTKVAYDGLGDRITEKTSYDAYGDKIVTKTVADPYGDKWTTKTITDPLGDKKTTRTFEDPWGDKLKTSSYVDRRGDRIAQPLYTDSLRYSSPYLASRVRSASPSLRLLR